MSFYRVSPCHFDASLQFQCTVFFVEQCGVDALGVKLHRTAHQYRLPQCTVATRPSNFFFSLDRSWAYECPCVVSLTAHDILATTGGSVQSGFCEMLSPEDSNASGSDSYIILYPCIINVIDGSRTRGNQYSMRLSNCPRLIMAQQFRDELLA